MTQHNGQLYYSIQDIADATGLKQDRINKWIVDDTEKVKLQNEITGAKSWHIPEQSYKEAVELLMPYPSDKVFTYNNTEYAAIDYLAKFSPVSKQSTSNHLRSKGIQLQVRTSAKTVHKVLCISIADFKGFLRRRGLNDRIEL